MLSLEGSLNLIGSDRHDAFSAGPMSWEQKKCTGIFKTMPMSNWMPAIC